VTVRKINDGWELVDGQQRTTSLYLLLQFLGKHELPTLRYEVRDEAEKWLQSSPDRKNDVLTEEDSRCQDLFALKQAWEQIRGLPNDLDRQAFAAFIQDHVKIIFIVLDTEPTKVFSMMNREKAVMTQTDLVKAHLLHEASRQAFDDLDTHEEDSHEWQVNHLRSHFAREWDRWRKWWEEKEHGDFYCKAILPIAHEPPLSQLLRLYLYWNKQVEAKAIFSEYEQCISNLDAGEGNKRIEAVEVFEGLRKLQLILEEWYDDPVIYNWLGLSMFGSSETLDVAAVIGLINQYDSRHHNDEDKYSIFENRYRKVSVTVHGLLF